MQTFGPYVSVRAPSSEGVSVIVLNHAPVNAFNSELGAGLAEAVRAVQADPRARAMVVASARKGVFMAGADITSIRDLQRRTRSDPHGAARDLKALLVDSNAALNAIEAGSKPAVAAVDGIAFGGGCELAMSCHARVASPSSRLGLPELSLGIIPGFGGCQRLPRLVGAEAAIAATLSGRPFKAADALRAGLVDELADGDVVARAAALAASLAAPGAPPLRRTLELDARMAGAAAAVAAARARVAKNRKLRALPQYKAYLDAVEAGALSGGQAGVRREIAIMRRLVVSPVAQGLVHFFLAGKETGKVPGVTHGDGAPRLPRDGGIRTVAVLGGGTMGSGIVALCLGAGLRVVLKEISDKALAAGVARVEKVLARTAKKRGLDAGAAAAVRARLTAQTTYDGFGDVDLVIEAAVENPKVKKIIMAELERVCGPRAILATNTSTIDIALISEAVRPETRPRVLGLHFFAPAHVMPLAEIIRHRGTSREALAAILAFSSRTRKTPVVVRNCVGFAANRMFFPYGQAAALLCDSGVSPYEVDRALLRFGMPMGANQMADLSGLDVALASGSSMAGAYGDRSYLASSATRRLHDAGRLGQKTARGYYDYSSGKMRPDAEGIRAALEASRAGAGLPAAGPLTADEIVEICLLPVVNESYRIVSEGVVLREGDLDVCSVYGYGFPAARGGVLNWGRSLGLSYVAGRLATLASTFAGGKARAFFEPCEYLLEQARAQE